MSLTLMAISATAQTVTGNGTTGTVAQFYGTSPTSVITSSPISIRGSYVGIGTPTPDNLLQLSGSQSYTFLSLTNTTGHEWAIGSSGSGSGIGGGALMVYDASLNATRMVINSSGQVVVGSGGAAGQLSNGSGTNYGDLGNGLDPTSSFNWHGAAGSGWSSFSSAGQNGLVVATDQTNGITFQVSSGAYNGSSDYRANHLFTVQGGGNVGIGTTNPGAKLEVNGGLRFTSDPSNTVQTTAWTGTLCGGDYAESVDVTGDRTHYGPGDVLVIDPDAPGKFLKSAEPYSTAVLGVYSTKPGVLGRRQTGPKTPDEIPMAMVGIVPAKVSAENGAIRPGDLLVTASTPGYAMKGTDRGRMLGAIVGKAMGSLDSGTGVIEVGVTLQ